ncbi:MAG: prolyl oligopeptidase family serine peptidase [Chloroflexaceae bacterium]|jgi:predicted peptidase|nr:prolyl oligopeptidase family serine peptidase [Chloroflexaceae bacterium]
MSQHGLQFERRISRTVRFNYLLFLPRSYTDDGEPWPLILFLHGSGERGDDLNLVRQRGIPQLVDGQPDFPFVVLAPQCPQNTIWSVHLDGLDALLDALLDDYNIDPDRVAITGMSMGGSGAWHMAVTFPRRFAAVVPVCGGRDWYVGSASQVGIIRHVPVWAFHGKKDKNIAYTDTERLVEALQESGGEVRFTLYPKLGHNCWDAAYATEELYEWLLEQRRAER